MNPKDHRAKPRTSRVLVFACLSALAAVFLMCWQLFDPGPLQVIVAMSVGQVLGTGSFVAFLYVVLRDLRSVRTGLREAIDRTDVE